MESTNPFPIQPLPLEAHQQQPLPPVKRPINISNMPFEVTTTIVREVFRDAVIKLNEIESLGRLGDIATIYNPLAVLTIGVIPEDLASKLMV